MPLEPVLLGTPLSAVFDFVLQALGTSVERNELLVELTILFAVRVLLVFHQMLQRTLVVGALTYVNELVRWRLDTHVLFAVFLAFTLLLLLPSTLGLRQRGHGMFLLFSRKLLIVGHLTLCLGQLVVMVEVAEAAGVHYGRVVPCIARDETSSCISVSIRPAWVGRSPRAYDRWFVTESVRWLHFVL